jgi:glycosyltransferase involved in cell wall biosynthesis
MSPGKRVKILRIQSRICIGGPALHTELLSRYLPTSYYSTLLIGGAVDKGELSRLEEMQAKGLRVAPIAQMHRNINLIKDLQALIAVYRIIRKEKPTIVCTHTSKAGAVGRTAALLAGVPLIFHTFHGHAFSGYFSRPAVFLFLMIERLLARFTARIIAISPTQLKELTEKYHVAPINRFTMIRLGFELENFQQLPHTHALKARLGLAENDRLIAVIGRLVPIKNVEAALAILQQLQHESPRYHLAIVGDGTERARLENICSSFGLSPFVHFIGWVQQTTEIYAGVDLLLLTSLNEGTPVAIIEAMAASVPVVAANVGGVPDLINDNETGKLFDVKNPVAAAFAISKIFKDQAFRRLIIKNALQFVHHNYHYTHLIHEMDSLYRHHLEKLL